MWPNGKKCAVVLTFDFDAESLFVEGQPIETVTPAKLSQGEYGARVGVPRILPWLKREELPATFFIPGVTAEKYPHLAERIMAQGLEIAHHGYTHAEPFSMTPADEREDLEKGIEALQKLTGKKPLGYRAPSWAPSHQTLPLLDEYGFLYDASLLGDERPYVAAGTKGLIEIPSDWCLDDAPHYFFNFSPRYRTGLSAPSKVMEIWKAEFDGIYADGGCYVLAMHPQISGRSHRLQALDEVVRYIRQHDVWFATMEEVALYWLQTQLSGRGN
ncbi:polysaccharide deacetylase family protein [Brevibacillus massiliensis]|jgi:peptidoglycan/xylan/chitin deacetylase (PgdA/CDA1 family)|uniref:polysaccharide deacetylase family protein n=1 Tax=Brevibacillus massiliensis TaxID=1118054 RepID=UPI0002FD2FDB|nr:polysaccharide deacetylase [Brevibacillus massiliensis]